MAQKSKAGQRSTSTAYPQNYFFYGSLMDPTRLSSVLALDKEPQLVPATVIGYRLMLWGPYPALIPEAGGSVSGLMYEVQNDADAQRLQRYETNNYAPQDCSIKLENDITKEGQTFIWVGARGDLEEGNFDLKAWQAENLQADQEAARIRALKANKPSIMARKFASMQHAIAPLPPGTKTAMETYPRSHFLYGSLTDPTVLSSVLGLKEPKLRQASVMGHRVMYWGQHTVLVRGGHQTVLGVVYELQNAEEAEKVQNYNPENFGRPAAGSGDHELHSYDPGMFRARMCSIQFEDGTTTFGSALAWDGDKGVLKAAS